MLRLQNINFMGSRGSCERGVTGNLYITWHATRCEEFSMALRSHHHRPCCWLRSPHLALHFPCAKRLRHDSMIRIAQQVKLEPVKPCLKSCNQDSETVWHLRHGNASQRRTKPPPRRHFDKHTLHFEWFGCITPSIKTGASYNGGLWLICQIPSLLWSRDPSFAQHVLGDTSLPDFLILAAKKIHCTCKRNEKW